MTTIYVLLLIQYVALLILFLTDRTNRYMDNLDPILNSKTRWKYWGIPLGIYWRIMKFLIKFIMSIPKAWNELPDEKPKDIIMKTKLVCDNCGGSKITTRVWVDANTNEYAGEVSGDTNDNWCDDCDDHVGFVFESDFDEGDDMTFKKS